MATEKEADKAREKYTKMLSDKGVHAIGVEEIGKKGSGTYGVIAYLSKPVAALPKELEIVNGKKKVMVPLIVKMSPKLRAE